MPVVVIGLPILPVRHEGAVVAVNYDAGETIGWPHFVDEVATAYRRLPIGSAILTGNYGEAGAIDRYGPDHGLPQAYSGHMAFAEWGPPPSHVGSVLAIGVEPSLLREIFGSVAQVGTLRNPWGIDNDEQDMPMYACRHMRRSWAGAWPLLQHY